MKKVLLIVLSFITTCIFALSFNVSAKGFAGPDNFFEGPGDSGGSSGSSTEVQLVKTGVSKIIHYYNFTTGETTPFNSGGPVYLELFIDIADIPNSGIADQLYETENLYGKLVCTNDCGTYNNKMFKVSHSNSYYSMNFNTSEYDLIYTETDLVYYGYSSTNTFLSSEISNYEDVTNDYFVYEYMGRPFNLFYYGNKLTNYHVLKRTNESLYGDFIISMSNDPYLYGLSGGYYYTITSSPVDNIDPMDIRTVPIYVNGEFDHYAVRTYYRTSWTDYMKSKMIIVNFD